MADNTTSTTPKNERSKSTIVWLIITGVMLIVIVVIWFIQSSRVTSKEEQLSNLQQKMELYQDFTKRIIVGKELSRGDIGEIFNTYEIDSELQNNQVYYKLTKPGITLEEFNGFYIRTDSFFVVKDFGFIGAEAEDE